MDNEVLYDKVRNIVEKNGIRESIKFFDGYDIICKVYGWGGDELFDKYFNECYPDYRFDVIRYEKSKYDVIIYVWNNDGDIIFQVIKGSIIGGKILELSDGVAVELADIFGDGWDKLCMNWFNREYEHMLRDVYGDDWMITDV